MTVPSTTRRLIMQCYAENLTEDEELMKELVETLEGELPRGEREGAWNWIWRARFDAELLTHQEANAVYFWLLDNE